MSTNTQTLVGLAEIANRSANGGAIAVANTLSQRNEWLRGATWVPANMIDRHKISQVVAQPTGNKRQLNDGVARESSKTKPVFETMQMLEGYSDVDEASVQLAPDPAAFRESEDLLYVAGMTKTLSTDFYSGNVATNGLSMHGLLPRLSTLVAGRVVSAGASSSGSMTSCFVVKWGPGACNMIYPANMTAGIAVRDMGLRVASGVTANTQMNVYTTHIKIACGFAVQDIRHLYRIANIATSGSSNVLTSTLLINGIGAVARSGDTTGIRILMNQTAFNQLDVEATGKANVTYGPNDPFGRPQPNFRGFPIDIFDGIPNTETTVS